MFDIKDDRKYTSTHQWAKLEDGRVLVGITDYAQRRLRAIVFVDLPEPGDTLTAGEPLGEVESVKVVAEVASPVSGVVSRVNDEVMDDPTLINKSPYDAWFVEVEDASGYAALLTAQEYGALLDGLAGPVTEGEG